ncbi:unnamed protein product [Symbiodinium natans]|uniref:Uncharacterized protein n=1 Tax=Symbiodinium natans TaxID=878477 RepID=A0A812J727_9DINO|nr:unnamed protein product [Symbiodinium natans]
MQAYHESSSDGKHDLIAKYMKEGGIKSLAWVAGYVEKSKTREGEQVVCDKGWFTMLKIFEREGVVLNDKKRQPVVLEAMRKANYQEHSVQYNNLDDLKKEIAGCPELTKYYYVFGKNTSIHSEMKDTSVEISTSLKPSNLALALKDGAASSSQTTVKIENPEKVQAQQVATVLSSGKAAIQKILSPIEDGISMLECKKKKEFEDFLKEGTSHVKKATDFVEKARKVLALHASMESDESCTKEAWTDHTAKIENMNSLASVHLDGLKHYKSRMQALS